MPLAAGDVLVFFTDGISEAMNAAERPASARRAWRSWSREHGDLPTDELRERDPARDRRVRRRAPRSTTT